MNARRPGTRPARIIQPILFGAGPEIFLKLVSVRFERYYGPSLDQEPVGAARGFFKNNFLHGTQ